MSKHDPFLLVGTTIAGKYAIESVVDEGGFSVIYRATHVIWNRTVAIKAFKASDALTEEARERLLHDFLQEGALMGELSERCSAVCQARDVATLTTTAGEWVPYMVLEWLEGECLEMKLWRERQEKASPRTLDETIELLAPIAEALSLAHDRGIAHRDLKPGNLFVLAEKRGSCAIKLLDFGIAKVCRDHAATAMQSTRAENRSFTPAYGAPEQFSPVYGATGPWTDVFALALIMVELLSGREAMDGDDVERLAEQATSFKVRPTPRTRGAHVSNEVEAIFRSALAVDPKRRFQTVRELWTAITHAATHAASKSTPPPALTASPSIAPGEAPAAARATSCDPDAVTDPHIDRPSQEPEATSTTLPRNDKFALTAMTRRSRRRRAGVVAAVVISLGAAIAFRTPSAPLSWLRSAAGLVATPSSATNANAPAASASPAIATSANTIPSTPKVAAAVALAPTRCPDGMALVPATHFFMGSDDGPADERPAHGVDVAAFCIDAREVTVAQYKACSDRGACKRAAQANDWPGIRDDDHRAFDAQCNAREPQARAQHPINCVDFEMAHTYCDARGARLPREAEWELAARGPDGRKFPWGDDDPSPRRANACGRECVAWGFAHGASEKALFGGDDGFATTAPVGSFPQGRSPYGADDMIGNVWEWVDAAFAPYASAASKSGAPSNESAASGARVIRGGAWNASSATWMRATFRNGSPAEAKSYGIGFRCAVSLSR